MTFIDVLWGSRKRPNAALRRAAVAQALRQRLEDAHRRGDHDAARVYENFLLYANVGPDRNILTMAWVERADQLVKEQEEMFAPPMRKAERA